MNSEQKCLQHGAAWNWPIGAYRCGCVIPQRRLQQMLEQCQERKPQDKPKDNNEAA